MYYIMTMTKALALVLTLHSQDGTPAPIRVGDEALCPGQDASNDEECDCRVIAVSRDAGIVVLVAEERAARATRRGAQ